MKVAVAGAGIFGVTAALSLRRRGHEVALIDPGPLPHPLAASTDISKVVRLEYGTDAAYLEMMEQALAGWRRWNQEWGAPLYHEVGVAFLRREGLMPGGFEYESLAAMVRRGHRPELLDAAAIARRFPAWNSHYLTAGIFHAQGGFAESGKVVARLIDEARRLGVTLHEGQRLLGIEAAGGAVSGLRTDAGVHPAERVVVAAGAWTAKLLPHLHGLLVPRGQPVFFLRPKGPAPYQAARFPVFGADISRLGYYGFPVNAEGIVKIANHGAGRILDPDAPRHVTPGQEAHLRAFLRDALPGLADAELVGTRLCLYCDTPDGHFLIGEDWRDPGQGRLAGLVVAAGGSGHAFKFAPLLGDLIADAAEGRPASGPAARFRFTPERLRRISEEEARATTAQV